MLQAQTTGHGCCRFSHSLHRNAALGMMKSCSWMTGMLMQEQSAPLLIP